MIVKFPTGLYSTVLPQKPQDGGNVTFTISNNPPPRTNLVFSKIPPGVVDKKRDPRSKDLLQRRDTLGDLAFTISQSKRDVESSNNKIFETGQILEFTDGPLRSLEPMLVNAKTEIRHDTNRINYDPLDVSIEEQQFISDASLLANKSLQDNLNIVRQQRRNAEQLVISSQKVINDSNRTIDALNVIQDRSPDTDSDVDELIAKLEKKKDEAFIVRDQASKSANSLAVEATRLQDELRTVSTVLT